MGAISDSQLEYKRLHFQSGFTLVSTNSPNRFLQISILPVSWVESKSSWVGYIDWMQNYAVRSVQSWSFNCSQLIITPVQVAGNPVYSDVLGDSSAAIKNLRIWEEYSVSLPEIEKTHW